MARKTTERQEEQPDKLRKTAQFEHEPSSSTSASSMQIPVEYIASYEVHAPSKSVLVQRSGHIDDDDQIAVLDATLPMDRTSPYTTDVVDWYT